MIKPCLKLVTFDATNTLLKFRVPPWKYYKKIVDEYGFETDESEIKKHLLKTFKSMHKSYPNFGKGSIGWEEWWRKVVKKTLENVLPQDAPYFAISKTLIHDFKTAKCWCAADGAQKLLEQLNRQSIDVGVISNFDPRLVDILKCLCLYDHIKFVVLSYNVGYSKPDKRIFDLARAMCGGNIQPQACLHVGDDLEKDYLGARAAGWHAYLLAEKPLETPPAEEHVFTSLDKLCNALEKDKN